MSPSSIEPKTPEATVARPEWLQQKERGSRFWVRFMTALSLWVGRRLSRPIVYGIALYFMLAVGRARRASRAYLGRALGRKASWWEVYRHILTFAGTIHDRLYLLNDREADFDCHLHGADEMVAAYEKNGGLFLFGAHFGSFEVMRTLARTNPKLKLSLAMYPDNARQLNDILANINPDVMQDIIPLGHLDSMLLVHTKLRQGALVGILADRASGADRYQSVNFLGESALFPTGAFRMAALLQQPVFFMAGLYRDGKHYDIHFEPLADFSAVTRETRNSSMEAAIIRYAEILEQHCRARPYNWFNFFDFWGAVHDKH
jgi:predicted LPLAT superfamily acyltransferase